VLACANRDNSCLYSTSVAQYSGGKRNPFTKAVFRLTTIHGGCYLRVAIHLDELLDRMV